MKDELFVSVYHVDDGFSFCWSYKSLARFSGPIIVYSGDFAPYSLEGVVKTFRRILDEHAQRPIRLNVYDLFGREVNTDERETYRILGNMKTNHNVKLFPEVKRNRRRKNKPLFTRPRFGQGVEGIALS